MFLNPQVKYARRKKTDWDDRPLYVTKCYELANHYLGFNGWSSKIISVSTLYAMKRLSIVIGADLEFLFFGLYWLSWFVFKSHLHPLSYILNLVKVKSMRNIL